MGPVKKPAKSKTYYSGRLRERIYNEYFRVSKTAKKTEPADSFQYMFSLQSVPANPSETPPSFP